MHPKKQKKATQNLAYCAVCGKEHDRWTERRHRHQLVQPQVHGTAAYLLKKFGQAIHDVTENPRLVELIYHSYEPKSY